MEDSEFRDVVEIQRLFTTYVRAVDSKDWELYRSMFTDDAVLDYTSAPFGIRGGVGEIVDWLSRTLPLLPMTMHYVTNVETQLTEGGALVRAQFLNPMRFPGSVDLSCCGGYYHHTLIRTDDGWRSRELREENVWFHNLPKGLESQES
jgi:hypothetical protein